RKRRNFCQSGVYPYRRPEGRDLKEGDEMPDKSKINYLVVSAATAFLTLAFSKLAEPVFAQETSGSALLIEKEVEVAVCKHVQKRFFNLIQANAEQRSAIESLLGDGQERTRPMREELREGLLVLNGMVAGETASDSDIEQKAMELRSLHEKIM